MFSFFYNFILLLIGIAALPKLLWQRFRSGKYRESAPARIGLHLPDISPKEKPTIWIHTISVGETRAVIPLFKKIRSAYPHSNIVISTITETGHAEAKRCMKEADAHFFLPLDFSWIIKKAVNKYKPDIVILVESDFWFHFLSYCKKNGATIFLVNGKMSERSFSRFKTFSFFSSRIFSLIDHFFLQSERFAERFLQLAIPKEKITVTGNLKLDASSPILSESEKAKWKEDLGIKKEDKVLVIGSTHEPEEEWLLSALEPVWKAIPNLKVLIVPRHPERFLKVKDLILAKKIPMATYTERSQKTGEERVLLIDAMGILNTCYQLADAAIVAGSFTDKVGGHNIFEPVLFGVPVLYGPHMHSQLDLVQLMQNADVGEQVDLEKLPSALLTLFQDPAVYETRKKACLALSQEAKGSTNRTWDKIQSFLQKKH